MVVVVVEGGQKCSLAIWWEQRNFMWPGWKLFTTQFVGLSREPSIFAFGSLSDTFLSFFPCGYCCSLYYVIIIKYISNIRFKFLHHQVNLATKKDILFNKVNCELNKFLHERWILEFVILPFCNPNSQSRFLCDIITVIILGEANFSN